MRNFCFRRLLYCLLTSLLSVGVLLAQESSGTISGTATDESGAVVPGVQLTLASPTLPRGLSATTDNYGKYTFPAVPIGTYTLTAGKEGFSTVKQHNIEVKLGSEITYNVRLVVGAVTQTVEVAETAQVIDVTSSRTATNITASQFENLPKGRTFNSLLGMAPGVILDDKASSAGVGGIAVDGASGAENVFIIDGVDVTDIRSGALRAQNALPFQFVQDIQVKSGGFEAEYGGANGGVVNVATRGGTESYHGSLDMEFTNNQLNPRPRGYWQRSPLSSAVADFYAPKKDTYRTLYPGFTLAGPIIHNRVHFLAGYQPTFTRTERIIAYPAPTGTRQYMREDITHYGITRLDYSPTDRLQVYGTWMWAPSRQKGAYPSSDPRLSPPSNDLSIQGGYVPSNAVQASANYTVTNTTNISFRYGYRYLNDKGSNYGLATAPFVQYINSTAQSATPVPSEYAGPVGFRNVSSTFGIVRDLNTRKNIYLDASKLATLFGQQHNFKFGWMLNKVGNDIEDDYTNGRFDMYWGGSFSRGSINNAGGTYGYYIWEDGTRHNSKVNGRNQGLYAQDNWRVHRNVSLNLGVRFENEYLPPYTPEVNGVKVSNPVSFSWGDKIAPRLGFAWDVKGDGRWKLSSSFGMFYDVMKYELARTSFLGEYWFSNVYRLDNPNFNLLGKAKPDALGSLIIRYDNRTAPINSQGQLDGIDPDIKPFTTREFTTTLEHQLSSRTLLAVRYTRKDLLRTIEDIGVLDEEDNEVYLIGNPGFGLTRDTNSVYGQKTPNGKEWLVPKAVRQYDAFEFRVNGNPLANLMVQGSYTWSRLYGNTSGLANSDESGRAQPGVSRMWDLPYYYFDETGSQKNVLGRLGLDRPHVLKFFGTYDLKTKAGRTSFGLTQIAYSGTPESSYFIYLSAPTYSKGRGDMGRVPVLTQTDLGITQQVSISERATLRFSAQGTNVLNQAAVTNRVQQRNRSGAITDSALPISQFFAGYNTETILKTYASAAPANPIFNLPGGNYRAGGSGAYQNPRNIRLGINLIF